MQAPVRSYEGLTDRVFLKESVGSQEAAVLRYWARMGEARNWLDTMKTAEGQLYGGCPLKFAKSGLLMFHVVALVLNKHITEAFTLVQESPALRRAAGYPAPSQETLAALATAKKADEVKETDFPARQTVVDFFRWLERWGGEDQHDDATGDTNRVVSLEVLEELAYTQLPFEAHRRFGVSLDRGAVDSTRIKSSRRHANGARGDTEAVHMGRRKGRAENNLFGRFKVSVVASDAPLVVDSAITTAAETTYVAETTIDRLAARSERMKELAAAEGISGFSGLDGLLVVGDSGFHNHRVLTKLYEKGMLGAFRLPDSMKREVKGTRRVSRKLDNGQIIELTLDFCSDTTHFCPCDAGKHAHERVPMTQLAGRMGKNPFVYVQCQSPTCAFSAHKFYVPFRKADIAYADGRVEQGAIDYTAVTPIWRALKDIELAIWKGCQAIEHYHSQLLAKHGLGITDSKGRRVFAGDLRHRWFYLLGDIIWNLTILFNLEDGRTLKDLDRDEAWGKMQRNRGKLDRLTKRIAEDVGQGAGSTEPASETGKKPPNYAWFQWRWGKDTSARTSTA